MEHQSLRPLHRQTRLRSQFESYESINLTLPPVACADDSTVPPPNRLEADTKTRVKGVADEDDARLLEMGYKPELIRSMSALSMLGLAFSVLSSWGEIGSSLTSGLSAGGPVVLLYGWLGVSLFSLAVVMSLAEICSAYPVNAGQYYWVAILSSKRLGRGLSYITAWGQLAGLVGVGAAAVANVAESTFGMAVLVNPNFDDAPWKTVLECWAVIVLCCAFNIYGRKFLNGLGIMALIWGVGGLIITVIVILSTTDSFQAAEFVFTEYANTTGLPDTYKGVVVCLGVTNLSYVYTAYESPAHMVEEMNNAQEDAPKAMVYSVYLGFLAGLAYLLAILFCISNLDAVIDSDNPIFPIYQQAAESRVASCFLGFILLATQVFAELSFIAETSRSVMAFGRDGGLPYSHWFATVHERYNVPVNAILATGLAQGCVMAIYFGSSTAFLTILAIGTVGLYFSYAMAIGAMLYDRFQRMVSRHQTADAERAHSPRADGRPGFQAGPYTLHPLTGLLCNTTALAFLVFEMAWFFVPTRYPVTATNMNYMCVAAAVVGGMASCTWACVAQRTYTVTGNVARESALQNARRVDGSHGKSVLA